MSHAAKPLDSARRRASSRRSSSCWTSAPTSHPLGDLPKLVAELGGLGITTAVILAVSGICPQRLGRGRRASAP